MPLAFRLARASEYRTLENLVLDSFEPITWFKRADERFGPLNGHDWRQRWQVRFAKVFETQIVLVGEREGEPIAIAAGSIDPCTKLGYIDLLAVDQGHQGKGYGREMLRGMLRYMKDHGAVHANLECLADNDAGNQLYRSEGFQEVARSVRWFIKIP
jgi:ribosomal protein S18 acetylase RimI-like enzyme